jgi:ABC-type oligopeptide transport system ATPase subunit
MENIFSEIEDSWSQEAKNEDSKRFFYHLKEIDSIEKKKKHFVIGRKGSGKSAIAKYLEKNVDYNKFAVKLNFKSFPFNVLYDLYDSGYKVPNQYITIWKYVIYSHIAKMMIKNENIDDQIREPLKDAYGNDPKKLADMIKIWTSAEFKIAGTGASFKRDLVKNETGWIDKVSLLEECILTYIDESTYFIIFDELDEDYREITSQKNHEAYTSLLTSLFKAVQDIKTTFEDFPNIKPIVFLRDDIYELMKDNDKTKWAEQTLKIDWDENKLKELFRFRISRTINSSCETTLPLNEIENILFLKNKIQYGSASNRKEVSFIDYILLNTHLRPRDLIQYIKFCAEQANNENKKK